jgi:hypothetical protein
MFGYNDLGYQTLPFDGYVKGPSREDIVQRALQLWNEGHVCIVHRRIFVEAFLIAHAASFRSLLATYLSSLVGN